MHRFGMKVVVTHKLVRRWESGGRHQNHRKIWRAQNFREPKTVMVIGERTLSDGEISWGGMDEATIYYPKRHFTALLVVEDMKHNPFYVLGIGACP